MLNVTDAESWNADASEIAQRHGRLDTPIMINESVLSMFSGMQSGGTRESAGIAARSLNLMSEAYTHDVDIANAVLFLASEEAGRSRVTVRSATTAWLTSPPYSTDRRHCAGCIPAAILSVVKSR